MTFDGKTFDKTIDGPRLRTQLQRVHDLMEDGQWRTLTEIGGVVTGTETAISARLRDIRKGKLPGWTMESERVKGGMWRYRVVPLVSGQGELF